MSEKNLGTRQKALKINLDSKIYGSFAEIGAGQDVAAHFFKAGGASGTIAKTMSAYDMTFSDAIYGTEESGRYVCEPRLMKMLNREFQLLEKRLGEKRGATTQFFAFANTVAALNFKKTNEAHGWIGLRFQLEPQGGFNDVVIHIRMLDNTNELQQQAIGVIGVNLMYACFYLHSSPEDLLSSLMDDIGPDRIEIDMIRFAGPDFKHVDNRLMSLYLVKNGFTNATMFGPDGTVLQPSEVLYKKHTLVLRGRFRPVTHVNLDMLKKGLKHFLSDPDVDANKLVILSELTLHDLQAGGEINEKDFLDRVDILCSLGQTVMISNYHEYYKLVAYLSKLTYLKIGIVLGINNLEWIFEEDHYKNLPGGILEAFATLFSRKVKLYVYPTRKADGIIYTLEGFNLPPQIVDLYEYLFANNKLEAIRDAELSNLHIYSDNVLAMIQRGEDGWEDMVPPEVAHVVKAKCLFGYPCEIKPPVDPSQPIENPTVIEMPPTDLGIEMGYFGGAKI
ncbi:MAG: TonB-dependent receptor [Spirosomataceae bacterium]